MTHENMFTPTSELMQEWLTKWRDKGAAVPYDEFFAAQAAQWGADQELEACCKWLPKLPPWSADDLRRHRRPKLSSLKERALQAWAAVEAGTDDQTAMAVIRRALEQLND